MPKPELVNGVQKNWVSKQDGASKRFMWNWFWMAICSWWGVSQQIYALTAFSTGRVCNGKVDLSVMHCKWDSLI